MVVLPVDENDYSFRFYKNLNEDVKLKSDEYGRWDIDLDIDNDDWVQVNGFDSVINACLIAIMTRLDELKFMDLYDDFGCRIHELAKANKTNNVKYKIELFVVDVLNDMRRVKKVNWVKVIDDKSIDAYNYKIAFNISCVVDEDVDEDDVNNIISGELII